MRVPKTVTSEFADAARPLILWGAAYQLQGSLHIALSQT